MEKSKKDSMPLEDRLHQLEQLRQSEDVDEWGPHKGTMFGSWIFPILLVSLLVAVLHVGVRFADVVSFTGIRSFAELFVLAESDRVTDAIGGMAEVVVALLGLVITVVAIVVQLASQRYTPKLVELFVADRINIGYFTLMVVTSMYSVLVIYSVNSGVFPFWGALSLVALSILVMILLLPYFSYVFRFLTPANILITLRRNALRSMKKASRWGGLKQHQENAANATEQITDIALSAVSQTDRNVALLSLRSLRDVMIDHMLIKKRMPKKWFKPEKKHFPAISSDFFDEISQGNNWLELRGFMDMDLVFKSAVQQMPDVVSAIANNTRIMGHYAILLEDRQVLNDAVQFFNTFLRHSLNARNPKAIYNILYQYRLLAEEILESDAELAEKIAFYFKFYGQTAQNYNIPLILITVCFDLASILKRAYHLKSSSLDKLLKTFLEVDDNPSTRANEFDLRSVRKAQISLASFMLAHKEYNLLQQIIDDLSIEPKERMEAILNEIMAVSSKKFWEITDRGVDFFYLDDQEKQLVKTLFEDHIFPTCQKNSKTKEEICPETT